MKNIINIIEKYGTIILGIFIILGLIVGTIGVIIEKIRTGHLWKGQGYGDD